MPCIISFPKMANCCYWHVSQRRLIWPNFFKTYYIPFQGHKNVKIRLRKLLNFRKQNKHSLSIWSIRKPALFKCATTIEALERRNYIVAIALALDTIFCDHTGRVSERTSQVRWSHHCREKFTMRALLHHNWNRGDDRNLLKFFILSNHHFPLPRGNFQINKVYFSKIRHWRSRNERKKIDPILDWSLTDQFSAFFYSKKTPFVN